MYTYGWLSKLWSLFGYPKYSGPYYSRDPKRDHNFDNHPYPWGQYRYLGNLRNQKKRGHRKQQQDSSAGCRSSVHHSSKGIVSILDHTCLQKRQASKFSPVVPHAYTVAPRPQPQVPNLWCQSLRLKPHIFVLQVPAA